MQTNGHTVREVWDGERRQLLYAVDGLVKGLGYTANTTTAAHITSCTGARSHQPSQVHGTTHRTREE
jgi:hypothetical protein